MNGYWQYGWIWKHNLETWPSIWKDLLTWKKLFELGNFVLRRIHGYSLRNIGNNMEKSTITWKHGDVSKFISTFPSWISCFPVMFQNYLWNFMHWNEWVIFVSIPWIFKIKPIYWVALSSLQWYWITVWSLSNSIRIQIINLFLNLF